MNAVIIENLTKSYEHKILSNINLIVPQGQILGIIGKSGAGKSTLLRCINGLETLDSGKITIHGRPLDYANVSQKRALQQSIGNVFQKVNLLSRLTALENVMFPLELLGMNRSERQLKAEEILCLVGLGDKGNSYPSQLSGGQCQRVAIARALVGNVSLLLCDEFTSALDSETALEILEMLRNLNKKLNVTIILITHDMAVVREICDEVCVLSHGEIVEKNDITSILLHPQHLLTKTLIHTLLNRDLPHHLKHSLKKAPTSSCDVLLRFFFSREVANEPVIANLIETFNVPINILSGNLDHVRETAFGMLIVSFPYHSDKLHKIIDFLEQKKISVEVLGYLTGEEKKK